MMRSSKNFSNGYCFVLLINPISGNQEGKVLLDLQAEKISFEHIIPNTIIDVYFYFLFNPQKRGFKTIKNLVQQNKYKIRVILCGGDGTFSYILDQLIEFQVPLELIVLGALPFGTGNDLSRVLGWGGQMQKNLIENKMSYLKQMCKQWVNSIVQDFNIWQIQFETKDVFKKVGKNNNNEIQKIPLTQKVIKRKLVNYFSMGIQSRVGFGFDKKRTQSSIYFQLGCLNMCCYGCQGIKKNFIKTMKISQVLNSIQLPKYNISTKSQQKITIIPKYISQKQGRENKYFLNSNPSTLIIMNIPSMMAGLDIWNNAEKNVRNFQQISLRYGNDKITQNQFEPMKFGDGKIELMSFQSLIGLSAQRLMSGNGSKICQTIGPLVLNFNDNTISYFQIDGQFFQVINGKKATIRICNQCPKINMLVRR